MSPVTMVELFGGIGAPRRALAKVYGWEGIEIVAYVENNPMAVAAYNLLYGTYYPPMDVRDYHLPDRDVDILFHGSPCQDFSPLGSRKGGAEGSGTKSSLLWETIRIVEEAKHKPKFIIWENVTSILSKASEKIYNEYVARLNKLGYDSVGFHLSPRQFGVPQSRGRAFVVSTINNPLALIKAAALQLRETKFPPIREYLKWDRIPFDNYAERYERYRVKQPSIIQAFKDGKVKAIKDYCYPITTKMVRWNNAGLVKVEGVDWEFPYRYLTPSECLKLMGFTWYDYSVIDEHLSDAQIYHLVGNSIVVDVVEGIFKALQ